MVRFDELPYQLTDAARPPLPPQPGVPRREDYEHVRRGTCNRFGCFEPHAGRRRPAQRAPGVTERRTAADFARRMRVPVDEWYPDAAVIRVVLDNPHTHTGAALYETSPPHEARRIVRKREWHDTPEHGPWLNQMEIEWSVPGRQCLDRRLGDVETVRREVAAWERQRNAAKATVGRRFGVGEARTKLARLYPA